MSHRISVFGCAAALLLLASPCLAFQVENAPTNADGSPRLVSPGAAVANSFSSSSDGYGDRTTTYGAGHFSFSVTSQSNGAFGSGNYGGYGSYAPSHGYLGPNDPRANDPSSMASPADRFQRGYPFGFGDR